MKSGTLKEFIQINKLDDLDYLAKRNDVYCDFVELKSFPSHVTDGIYFLATPDIDTIQMFTVEPERLLKLLHFKSKLKPDFFTPYCMVQKYIKSNNLEYFRDCCIKILQSLGLIKASFHEFSQTIPQLMVSSQVAALERLNRKRYDSFYAPYARKVSNEVYEGVVKRFAKKNYTKRYIEKNLYVILKELCGSPKVNYKYFEKNGISFLFYDAEEHYYRYFKREIRKYPYVKYFRAPYTMEIKDNSKMLSKLPDEYNITADSIGKKSYCIGIDSQYNQIYLKILYSYKYKDYRVPKSVAELQSLSNENCNDIEYTRISNSLMKDFYIKCNINRVNFMIDIDGDMAELNISNTIIVYNAGDKDKIEDSINQVVKDHENEVVVNSEMIEKARKNAPVYRNPILAEEVR